MGFREDLRFAARLIRKNLGFSLVIVLVLGVGIGANTTVFTLVNAVLFRPLPFTEGHRIVSVTSNNVTEGRDNIGVSLPDFRDWRSQAKTFKGLAASSGYGANLSDGTSTPERYSGNRMTANSFALIGQAPELGRDFTAADEAPDAAPVAIIGYSIWKNRYGGDRATVGRVVRINETPTTIIGVMPEGFRFPVQADLWQPLVPSSDRERRQSRGISVFGRLADGVALQDASREMNLIATRLQKEYPDSNKGVGIVVQSFNDRFNGGQIRIVFLALLGAVGFVLMIACANVANLLLSRALTRTKEISVRVALGASRWRVIRQLLVESVLLSSLGGLLGLAIAKGGVRAFDLAVADVGKPYWIRFTMDFTVFAYVACICILTGILFGIAPALHATKLDFAERLKESGRSQGGGSRRTRFLSASLVVSEIALSVVLLAGAGLMIRSFLQLQGLQSGVNPHNTVTLQFNLSESKYPKPESRTAFYDQLVPRLQAVAGVERVALTSNLPMGGAAGRWPFALEGQAAVEDSRRPRVMGLIVSPEYFRALEVPLVSGRGFDENDGTAGKEVAIVNRRFVARYFAGQDALGRRVRLVRENRQDPWLTVVGVSGDVRQNDPSQPEIEPVLYVPYRYEAPGFATVVARTRIAPASLLTPLRKEVQAVDQDLPVFRAGSLDEHFARQSWPFRVFGSLFAILAFVALLLSGTGIYSVMAYAVEQRTQEIGIRLALGAAGRSILWLVLGSGSRQLALGLALGLGAAVAATRVLETILVQVQATDPLTLAGVAALLTLAAVAACWLPVRRAQRVDPIVALRYE
jgi:predicted permease